MSRVLSTASRPPTSLPLAFQRHTIGGRTPSAPTRLLAGYPKNGTLPNVTLVEDVVAFASNLTRANASKWGKANATKGNATKVNLTNATAAPNGNATKVNLTNATAAPPAIASEVDVAQNATQPNRTKRNTSDDVAEIITGSLTTTPIDSPSMWEIDLTTTTAVPGCQLLSSKFGWMLQAVLAAVAFVSLVGKRFVDKRRRPWKVWFFDTSKQGFSAFLIHFVNIILAMVFDRWLHADADPCNWYWISLTLDDTLGVACQFILLRTLQHTYRLECVGRPELALSGEYGDPPSAKIFCRQLLDWQGLVIIQKILMAILVVNYTNKVAWVAEVSLGWLDAHPKRKLVVVMVFTPLVMNVFALWMADSFLQGRDAEDDEAEDRLVSSSRHSSSARTPSVVGNGHGHRRRGHNGSRGGKLVPGDDGGNDLSDFENFEDWKNRRCEDGVRKGSDVGPYSPSRVIGARLNGFTELASKPACLMTDESCNTKYSESCV